MSNLFGDLTGGGVAGFQLFIQADNQPGIYADDNARDAYFAAVPADLARLDANEFLIIKILDNGSGEIAYQQRSLGVFVDVTSLVQGETGPPGATGNSFFFKNIAQRDQFFNIVGNEQLLETGLPVVVNQGNAVTTFIWVGVDQPATYDPDLFIEQALNSGPGTLFLGLDGTNLSSAAKTLNFISAYGDKAIPLGQAFTDDGSTGPTHFRFTKVNDLVAADIFDTQLPSPNEWLFDSTVFNSYTEGLTIRPATSGKLRLKAYAGNTDTFPIVIDKIFDISAGDIGNIVSLPFSNGLLGVAGDNQLIVISGIDLFGGLQTDSALPFFNQTVGLLGSKTFILTLSDLITRNQLDDYVFLNSKYSTPIEKSGGISVTTLPTTTVATVTVGEFIPGVDTTNNPTVTTVESDIFTQGDLVCYISDPGQPNANDNIYEVHDHTGTACQMRGVGLNALVEDFTQDQFVNLISTGKLTKVGVAVLKMTATELLAGFGSTTPISFNVIGNPGGSNTELQFNNSGVIDGISGVTTDGTDLFVSGQLAIGNTDPKTNLHIVTDGTPSALSASIADRGIVITGSDNRTRIYFELPNTTTNKRVFSLGHEQDALKFMAHTNEGGAILQQNLITLQSEGPIGMGVAVADSSAQLELGKTIRGFLQTRLTDTQRDAISNPKNGLSLHNTTSRRPQFFDDLDGTGGAWNKISVVSPTTIEIFTAADLDDLATAGVITVADGTNIVLDIKPDSITTDVHFVIEGSGTLSIISSNPNAFIFYTGSATYVSGIAGALTIETINIVSVGTGTFMSLVGATPATVVDIQNALFVGWDNIGTLTNALLGIRLTQWIDIGSGLTLDDVSMEMVSVFIVAPAITSNFINIEPGKLTHSFVIGNGSADIGASNALVRIDPGITNASVITLDKWTMVTGDLLDTTGGSTGTFTAVADASTSGFSIDSVSNVNGLTGFNFTPGPTIFTGQEVTIAGFITNTAYNGTFIVINDGFGIFEINVPFGSDEATGDFSSNSVTVTSTAHGLNEGSTLVIDTTQSTDYDGGATIYNQQTNSFQINRIFTSTQVGAWDTSGIDQSDPRVLSSSNPGFIDSNAIAFGTANASLAPQSITDGLYVGVGVNDFFEHSSTQRFKNITNFGRWEYEGNERFDGLLTATIFATKTGSTANYRFALSLNGAVPNFANSPYTPMEVKTTKVGITMLAPVSLVKGDHVQIYVAGDGTSDGMIVTDLSISIQ